MSQLKRNQVTDAETEDSTWKGVYRIGGAAALIAVVMFLIDMIVIPTLGLTPSTAEGCFTLLQNNRLEGLLRLYFTDIFGVALYCPMFFALYAALRRTNKAYSALAMALAFVGVALTLATSMSYSMVNLSDQYAAATTDAQRSLLLAAGEAILAISNGTGSSAYMGGFFIEGAAVIISVLMLRSKIFSKGVAYVGILGHGLDLVRIIINLALVPVDIDVLLLAIGGPLQLIWLILLGRRFFQLGQGISKE